jgi:hypothetical protein
VKLCEFGYFNGKKKQYESSNARECKNMNVSVNGISECCINVGIKVVCMVVAMDTVSLTLDFTALHFFHSNTIFTRHTPKISHTKTSLYLTRTRTSLPYERFTQLKIADKISGNCLWSWKSPSNMFTVKLFCKCFRSNSK